MSDTTIHIIDLLITMFAALAASSGFWLFIEKRKSSRSLQTKLLMGLAHDRIIFLSVRYIKRGWITQEEYENLHEFLYSPYIEIGGNGTAIRLMNEVNKLKIRSMDEAHAVNMKGDLNVKQ